jgi:hypothetical protein
MTRGFTGTSGIIRENIKISGEENLGYCELKQQK